MTQAEGGAQIRALRDQAGITKAELAESLMRDTDELSAIEAGERALSPDDIRALARVFPMQVGSLAGVTQSDSQDARRAA